MKLKWKNYLRKIFPFLFIKCSSGNYHWRYEKSRVCLCNNDFDLLDMKTGNKYVLKSRYDYATELIKKMRLKHQNNKVNERTIELLSKWQVGGD